MITHRRRFLRGHYDPRRTYRDCHSDDRSDLFCAARWSSSALTCTTFCVLISAPAQLVLSSTSIHRPGRRLPVNGGTHIRCVPFVTVTDARVCLSAKFSCVDSPETILALLMEAFTPPFTTSVTRYLPGVR